ncbi:MAG: endonuclease [Prevotella sp.]|nr:endonuclease [Prevotella sp.]
MKSKTLLTLCLLAAATIGTWAQGPNGSENYYQAADGKCGEALKTAMYNIIKKQDRTPSYDNFLDLYKQTDTRPDGKVRDWYSNVTNYVHINDKAGTYKKEGDVYNREHLIPQGWGANKAGDIIYVVPTDGYINGMRGDLPLGEVGNVFEGSANNYSKWGASVTPGYTGKVFEPNNEVKGDIARIYFYFATRYATECAKWSGTMFNGKTEYQPLAKWAYDMLVRWSRLDPIDEVEIARNNTIALANVQGNRNPFVDYPGLEDYIWGDKVDVPFSYDNYDASGTVIVQRVAQPVFSPEGGTFIDQVVVTMSTATEGALIHYTTDGSEPTDSDAVYSEPLTITKTTTLKAIAAKDSLKTSYVQTATYVIRSSQPGETTNEIEIALNNALFGTNFSGALTGGGNYSGTKEGITVTYSKGSGANQFINDSQIRLYAGNTLTITSDVGDITDVAFTQVGGKGDKVLQASEGTVNGVTWSGISPSVVFTVNDGSGHIQFSKAKVSIAIYSPQPVDGDVNGDGSVDVADIATVIDIMAGKTPDSIPPGTDPFLVADVNGDGSVDVADIAYIITVMAGGAAE